MPHSRKDLGQSALAQAKKQQDQQASQASLSVGPLNPTMPAGSPMPSHQWAGRGLKRPSKEGSRGAHQSPSGKGQPQPFPEASVPLADTPNPMEGVSNPDSRLPPWESQGKGQDLKDLARLKSGLQQGNPSALAETMLRRQLGAPAPDPQPVSSPQSEESPESTPPHQALDTSPLQT